MFAKVRLKLSLSPSTFQNLPARVKMVKLVCAIVGAAGNAFPVDIDADQLVGDLKKEIKAENPDTIKCEAAKLDLFLAKTDGGAWLDEAGVALVALDERGNPRDYEKMRSTLWIRNPMLFGDNFQPGEDQIHVLVVVPSGIPVASPEVAALESSLLQIILPHILTNAPTTLTERDNTFKERLCEYYGCFRRKKAWVRCMLLNVAFPRSLVIASHLFRRSNEYLSLAMMQISDIDHKKNGLLLFKPLEYALDHFQISFIRDDSDVFRLKLFDHSINDTRIIDLKDRRGNDVLTKEQTGVLLDSVSRAKKRCTFDVATTFGNLDGKPLVFTGLERPFYRCLNLQARVARMMSLKKNRIDASYDFEDFWTEVSLNDKMEIFHRSIMTADPVLF